MGKGNRKEIKKEKWGRPPNKGEGKKERGEAAEKKEGGVLRRRKK